MIHVLCYFYFFPSKAFGKMYFADTANYIPYSSFGKEEHFFSVSYQIKILVLQINKKKNSILLFNVQNSLEYRTFKCNKNKNLDKTMLLSLSTKVSQWNHVHFISSKSHEDNIFSFIYLLIWPTNFTNGPMGDYKKY